MRRHPVLAGVSLRGLPTNASPVIIKVYSTFAKQNNMARMMQSAICLRVLISHDILCSVGRSLCNSQHRVFFVCSDQQKTMPDRNVPDTDLICMNHSSSLPPEWAVTADGFPVVQRDGQEVKQVAILAGHLQKFHLRCLI